jgi:hypothetical protein
MYKTLSKSSVKMHSPVREGAADCVLRAQVVAANNLSLRTYLWQLRIINLNFSISQAHPA